jgi:hypothetical protein
MTGRILVTGGAGLIGSHGMSPANAVPSGPYAALLETHDAARRPRVAVFSRMTEEFLAGELRLSQNRHEGSLRKLGMVRDGDQHPLPFVPKMDVAPALADNDEPESRERPDDFPSGQDGKLGHHLDLDFHDGGSLLPGGELEEDFVVLLESLGQALQGLLPGLPLIGDLRDQVRRDVPLAFLLDLNHGLHDGEAKEVGV